MAYGKLKADTVVYDNSGSDVEVAISGIPTSTQLAAKADIASPTFTGTASAPTATSGTNTTQLATTEFVTSAVSSGAGASTSVANTWTAGQRAEITTLTDGATITPNLADSNNYVITLAGNRTIANPTNIVAGQSGSIFILQDGTGSRGIATWGSYWDFQGGTPPTLSSGANAVDRIDYVVRSSTSIHTVTTLNYS